MCLDLNPGEVGEGRIVGADDSAGCGSRGGSDDQVMRPPGPSPASDVSQQFRMHLRHLTVVVEDGDDL